jgi:hypothetical protein
MDVVVECDWDDDEDSKKDCYEHCWSQFGLCPVIKMRKRLR